jgi:putative transposase
MKKYQNKYRIESARAQWWDYGWNGAYFITICTDKRQHFFGKIVNGKVQLSPTGVLAHVFWEELPKHFPNLALGDFVVMPNHVHGILIINKPADDGGFGMSESLKHYLACDTKEQRNAIGQKRFQNIGNGSVSAIVGSYKSAVTKYANRLGLPHKWQRLFYDIIIKNEVSYHHISSYIINNPLKWERDCFNKAIM